MAVARHTVHMHYLVESAAQSVCNQVAECQRLADLAMGCIADWHTVVAAD